MPNDDTNVLVPISEFTKLLRRIADLEKRIDAMERIQPNDSRFKDTIKTAVQGVDFRPILSDTLRSFSLESKIREALKADDYALIARGIDLSSQLDRVLSDKAVVERLTRLVYQRIALAIRTLDEQDWTPLGGDDEDDER